MPQDVIREEHDPEVPAIPANTYLQVSDLRDSDRILTIARVVHQELFGEFKRVAEFHEIGKGLILDTVNLDAIEDKYGVNSGDWIEKSIQLYANEPEHEIRIRPGLRWRSGSFPGNGSFIGGLARPGKARAYDVASGRLCARNHLSRCVAEYFSRQGRKGRRDGR